jgi:hypothetical protein
MAALTGFCIAAGAEEGPGESHDHSPDTADSFSEEEATPSLAALQFMSISDEEYHRQFNQRSPRYSKRRRRGGVAFLCSGLGLLAVGGSLIAGGMTIYHNSTDPWLLEELLGGIMAGIGSPIAAAGIALTVVGSIRLSRRIAFVDRLSISPGIGREEKTLTLGVVF